MTCSLAVSPSPQPSFAEVLERLWIEKHTGPVIVHFAGGRPLNVEIVAPSQRIALDNRHG